MFNFKNKTKKSNSKESDGTNNIKQIKRLINDLSIDNKKRDAQKFLVSIGVEAVEQLITALPNSDGFKKAYIIEILGEIADSRATLPLMNLLKDKEIIFPINFTLAEYYITGELNLAPEGILNLKNKFSCDENTAIELMKKSLNILLESLVDFMEKSELAEYILMFQNEKFPELQLSISAIAAKALGNINDAKAKESLIIAQKESDQLTSLRASIALKILSDNGLN